jgi:hypothetical protein
MILSKKVEFYKTQESEMAYKIEALLSESDVLKKANVILAEKLSIQQELASKFRDKIEQLETQKFDID